MTAWAGFNEGLKTYQAGDYTIAAKEYRKAADKGDQWAQLNLGMMYLEGKGAAQNDIEAVKWFRMAAEQGNADAQNDLGLAYAKGRGVKQSYLMAEMWFKISVDSKRSQDTSQNLIAAQLHLSQV